MARTYSERLKNQIESYLRSQKWRYDFNADNGVFSFSMNIGTRMQSVSVRIFVRENGFTAFGYPPVKADPTTINAVNEYITRANYGLVQGSFELDYNDGEVRFKSHAHCGNDIPSIETVEFIVDMSFFMWKRYGDGLLAVIYGNANPKDEIQKAED